MNCVTWLIDGVSAVVSTCQDGMEVSPFYMTSFVGKDGCWIIIALFTVFCCGFLLIFCKLCLCDMNIIENIIGTEMVVLCIDSCCDCLSIITGNGIKGISKVETEMNY